MCIMLDPQTRFYHDLPKPEQDHWASELRRSPVSTQYTALTHAAYLCHPTSYIVTSEDQGLPQVIQRKMVQDMCDKYGITIPTTTLQASHSPFLSMPEELLDAVKRFIAADGRL